MTSIQEHERKVKQLQEDINEKINKNILLERQEILGFATSELATNLFAILMHKKHLIDMGFNVNHRFFVSDKRASSVFNFDFKNKKEILELMVKQEKFRNKLCYGKPEEIKIVQEVLNNLRLLKEKIKEAEND